MSNVAQPSLWRRLMGLPAPVREIDPADMGTAMGLDYCLDEVPEVVAATTLAKAGRASIAQADWLRRLTAS